MRDGLHDDLPVRVGKLLELLLHRTKPLERLVPLRLRAREPVRRFLLLVPRSHEGRVELGEAETGCGAPVTVLEMLDVADVLGDCEGTESALLRHSSSLHLLTEAKLLRQSVRPRDGVDEGIGEASSFLSVERSQVRDVPNEDLRSLVDLRLVPRCKEHQHSLSLN